MGKGKGKEIDVRIRLETSWDQVHWDPVEYEYGMVDMAVVEGDYGRLLHSLMEMNIHTGSTGALYRWSRDMGYDILEEAE